VQEALTNIAKHAGAATVELSVRAAGQAVLIEVTDDGKGFDHERPSDGGFGVTGMRERAHLAGGELSVLPGSGAGTVVRASLPLG
jgi:signal transduction histidine kinase